ncbi:MAG: hypothetical protein JO256_03420, partial [Alphaproteobacteria bacterium]|nr:hypothetical protein [Alphaproteobacteria bacterium]
MPAPSDRFANLEDLLLRGGIAPRHVRRYLRELSEHLADLTQAQREAGFDADDAAARARAALGPDQDLADAMLKQRDFRSLSARFPWLVFGLMPPFLLILGFALVMFCAVLIGVKAGIIVPDHKPHLPAPSWYHWTANGLMFAANFLITTGLAFLLVWMAQRQRMKPLWPLLGMAVILFLGVHDAFDADTKRLFIGLGTLLPFYPAKGPFGPWGSIYVPTLAGQAVLL